MKLSEAIRLGAMLRPQTTGAIYKHGKSCAWGAAWEAVGGDITHWDYSKGISSISICQDYWPKLSLAYVPNPITGDTRPIWSIIESLNDNPNCWTRERIADWVASIESHEEVLSDTTKTTTANPVSKHITSDTRVECPTAR